MNPAVLSDQTSVFVTFIASFLIWFMFAGLIVLFLIKDGFGKKQIAQAFFSGFVAWTASQTIKLLFPTLRPFEVNGGVPLTITIPFDAAFPSSHTAVSFGMASSIWSFDKRIGLVYLVSSAFVGLGRILGNVHFMIDILGGFVLGILSTYFVKKVQLSRLRS